MQVQFSIKHTEALRKSYLDVMKDLGKNTAIVCLPICCRFPSLSSFAFFLLEAGKDSTRCDVLAAFVAVVRIVVVV